MAFVAGSRDIQVFRKPGLWAKAGMVVADRYRLDRKIGTGGSATVWAATHLTLNRPIAIKFMEVVGPQRDAIHQRFLREARIAAAVRHRNVIEVIDFGKSAEGLPYMAMELLEGQTLGERMESGELIPVHNVVRIMARVLSGLGAAHDAGLVHRDVKPENIFLCEDADGVYPKLLDFGISRALDRTSEIESVLDTIENVIVGTPDYMSPEQTRGLTTIDHRSDLWSAGVMLYELLTGELPFEGVSVGDLLIQIATAEPLAFASLRPDLAGPLDELIMRALSKRPADRFENAREMRTSLLSAVARTAADIHAADGSARLEADTYETPLAVDLLEAVEDTREPGDSGMVDFSEHLELLESIRPPPPPPGLAPPPAPKIEHDPFAAPEAPPAATSLGTIFIAAAVGALAATAIGFALLALRADETGAPAETPDSTIEPDEAPDEPAPPGP